MPKEKTDFLEGDAVRRVRKVVDVVSAVGQDAAIAVDITNRRFAGDNILEASLGLHFTDGAHVLLLSIAARSLRDLRRLYQHIVTKLLQDGRQPRVEEAELEQHEERQRAVDPV